MIACPLCHSDYDVPREKCDICGFLFKEARPPKIPQFRGNFAFLSNFAPCPITIHKLTFPTLEHAFQAQKNPKYTKEFSAISTPALARKRGREILLGEGWEEKKWDIMRELVFQKFTAHSAYRKKLLETGNLELVEGNSWGDTYWGVDLRTGQGANHLGIILMEVREALRSHKGYAKLCPICKRVMDIVEMDVDEVISRYYWMCYVCNLEVYLGQGHTFEEVMLQKESV